MVAAMRLLIVLLLCLAPSSAVARPHTTLRVATFAPAGSPWSRGLRAWATAIAERSGGSVHVELVERGAAGSDRDVLRTIERGQLDGAHLTSNGLGMIAGEVYVLEVPMLLEDADQLAAARAELGPDLAAAFTAGGYRLLAWADLGERALFAPIAVTAPEDLRRVRVRVDSGSAIEAAMAHVFHLDAIALATSEVMAGLQTGLVDTVQASPLWLIASQWFRYGMRAGVRVGPAIGGVVLHERAYASLSRADRRVVEEVSMQLEDTMRELVAAEDRQATETLASWGVHVAEPSDAMREAYRRVGAYAAGRLFPAAWLERVEVALGRR
jgi:TRAP-type C4-dicarboxylate transport system substrate-binding protein